MSLEHHCELRAPMSRDIGAAAIVTMIASCDYGEGRDNNDYNGGCDCDCKCHLNIHAFESDLLISFSDIEPVKRSHTCCADSGSCWS